MRTCGPGPRFDAGIAPGGYAWWYVDALSDDGRHGLSVIALLGSVFSPYYARARARARKAGSSRSGAGADPLDHCALNVALYGAGGHRWAMTERRRADLWRDATQLRIGPSALAWDGETLTLSIDEVTAPWPSRIRGGVRVRPQALFDTRHLLDGAGRHRWQPIGPRSRVEVELERPDLRWHGSGYFDSNDGDAPLEDDFDAWSWSRTSGDDDTRVFYDVERADGGETRLALGFDPAGGMQRLAPPPLARLPTTPWGIARPTRADAGSEARVLETLEDGPFYARSMIRAQLDGRPSVAVHESLSLRRFRQGWVRTLLPFKMPRPPARQLASVPRPSDAAP
jgi:carotenoid 1,2-hydratase